MENFIKSPEMVEAEQWLGTELQVERFLAQEVIMISASRDGSVLVPTLDGNLTCRVNDYLVKNSDGTYTVVDGEEFESNYQSIDLDEALALEEMLSGSGTVQGHVPFVEDGEFDGDEELGDVLIDDNAKDIKVEAEVLDEKPAAKAKTEKASKK